MRIHGLDTEHMLRTMLTWYGTAAMLVVRGACPTDCTVLLLHACLNKSIEQICPQLPVTATAALKPLHATLQPLSAFDCTPWWLPVLLNLALQFVSTIYSTTSTVAAFSTTLSATAAKRTGYAYVTTATSSLKTIPAADLWAYEANTVGNATVC